MSRRGTSKRLLILVPTAREARLLFGARASPFASAGSSRGSGPIGEPRRARFHGRDVQVALTGCGLAAAGAAAARALERARPEAALLVGLAGTLDRRRLPVGGAMLATRVACDGIGAEDRAEFVSFAGPPVSLFVPSEENAGKRRPALALPALAATKRGELLSVAAAASPRMAALRRRRHPRALAEEMEGFAVAIAARLSGVLLSILRGASNAAGERNHRRWQPMPAVRACAAAARDWIAALEVAPP